MDRALDLGRLRDALGEAAIESPRRLPSAEELQGLLADAEMRLFLRDTEIPRELIRSGWYLHGIASSNSALELYSYARQRRAFEVSAHIFDLALNDQDRSRAERLSLAFGAQIGYRRGELDPNATAMFSIVEPLLIRQPPVEAHIETLALEAGVALLGFQTSTLFSLYQTWLRQLRAVQRQAGLDDLWGTLFGPAFRVVVGCSALLNFLAFGRAFELENARGSFQLVVDDSVAGGDRDARWVAAHLLDFTDEAEEGSVWRVLPPDVPDVAKQAFTLASPPVLTLWPPQRQLFSADEGHQPLSLTTSRSVLSIPTSSGKTLLAQLLIVSHLALGGRSVCYVAPLRSLGREVRRALRNRLRVLARELGAELPDFGPVVDIGQDSRDSGEIDGSVAVPLGQVLAGVLPSGETPDVEVMTPERLAHQLHRDPDAVLDRFQMFVFDEAHFIAERGRGFTLESILAFLHWKTVSTDHRIVLLSAALGNEGQIMTWLDPSGEGRAISSDWRGPRRLHAIFSTRAEWDEGVETSVGNPEWPVRKTYPLSGVLRLRPAEGAVRRLSITEPIGELALRYNEAGEKRQTDKQGPKDGPPHSTQQYKMTARMVSALGAFGSVLVVTSTRRIAQDMAGALAALLDDVPQALPLSDMTIQRLGAAHPLSSVVRKGVAFHHAALPVDVLEELEEALREGRLRYMTCTSTLTEGVNLPVRTVVLAETRWDGSESLLSGARLVNAMGRAGRAGKESEGWIVLVRANEEKESDFNLLNPQREELEIQSRLLSEEALNALAEFEERTRRGEDATFTLAAGAMAEFLAFVWFIFSSEEERGVVPSEVDLSGALSSTLAFTQSDETTRARYRAVGEAVRESYLSSDQDRRRRWAQSGTSISTARRLDDLARAIVESVQSRVESGAEEASDFSTPRGALRLLSHQEILLTLLTFPENDRPWRFRKTRGAQSAQIEVVPDAFVREWIGGTSIPDLAEAFLGEVTEQDWRVEQIVDAVAQHLEHFLAWTLGVLIELANNELSRAGMTTRLCPELATFVRYGVDSEIAVRLLVSGMRSRRLAHLIASEAAREEIAGEAVREWLGAMGHGELRERFNASGSEMLDLLEVTRAPRSSLLRDLLERGQAELTVQIIEAEIAEQGQEETGGDAEQQPPDEMGVELRSVEGEQPPPRLGIYKSDSQELIGLVPTPMHGDVQSIVDTGVPTVGVLRGQRLQIRLSPGEVG